MAESLNTPLATMSLVTPAINSRYSFSRFLRGQRWDPLPAGQRQGPLVDAAAAASEQSRY